MIIWNRRSTGGPRDEPGIQSVPTRIVESPAERFDFGQIFVPRQSDKESDEQPKSAPQNSSKTRLIVFHPESESDPIDFGANGDLDFKEAPLPVGFEGLAAATRGALASSLAKAAEYGDSILFIPGTDLEFNTSTLKKAESRAPVSTPSVGLEVTDVSQRNGVVGSGGATFRT